MDITNYVVSGRNEVLLVGDYALYRKRLSRLLLSLRRKLGRTTPKGRKYTAKEVTQDDLQQSHEFAHLLLLTAERAWAHAMSMKSMRAADSTSKPITGSTRKHVLSRLKKAERTAGQLVDLLTGTESAQSQTRNSLEARSYWSMLQGTLAFEAQKWEICLQAFSASYQIYARLAKPVVASQDDPFRELLTSTVEPSIRYAAYQLKVPRTQSIETISKQYPPHDASELQRQLDAVGETTTKGGKKVGVEPEYEAKDIPSSITWRTRTVKLEDANIAQALASVSTAERQLSKKLASATNMAAKDKAAAYDAVLIPSQDAVDATKTAIDELTNDGVSQSDQRMQGLQITRTAVNYALVGWRIGRNRVLCGDDDGVSFEPIWQGAKRKASEMDEVPTGKKESNSRMLNRLRERVVLYDTILQSLESIQELPGVPNDQALQAELQTKRAYFAALRCAAIARSHVVLSNLTNALALFNRAWTHSKSADPTQGSSAIPAGRPPSLDVSSDQITQLQTLLRGLVYQHHGLLEHQNRTLEVEKAAKKTWPYAPPLIERLDEYPVGGVDLSNLVIYPPRLRPIPMKPIFLDVAWNYIQYPGHGKTIPEVARAPAEASRPVVEEPKQPARKGWFGFGRS